MPITFSEEVFKSSHSTTYDVPELNYWGGFDGPDSPSVVACGISCRTNAGYFERNITVGARLQFGGRDVQIFINKGKEDEFQFHRKNGEWTITQDNGGAPSGYLSIEGQLNKRHVYGITFVSSSPSNNNFRQIIARYNHNIGCSYHIKYKAAADDDSYASARCGIYDDSGNKIREINEGNADI